MPKKTQKRNRRIKRKTLKNKRSNKISNKICRRCKKGGEDEKVTCCMCEREVDKNNTLVPRVCLNTYSSRAHRICNDCWWDPVSGFARENATHGCPGCAKKFPLTNVKSKKIGEIVDLSLDDE
jgi:hypothetical protein